MCVKRRSRMWLRVCLRWRLMSIVDKTGRPGARHLTMSAERHHMEGRVCTGNARQQPSVGGKTFSLSGFRLEDSAVALMFTFSCHLHCCQRSHVALLAREICQMQGPNLTSRPLPSDPSPCDSPDTPSLSTCTLHCSCLGDFVFLDTEGMRK